GVGRRHGRLLVGRHRGLFGVVQDAVVVEIGSVEGPLPRGLHGLRVGRGCHRCLGRQFGFLVGGDLADSRIGRRVGERGLGGVSGVQRTQVAGVSVVVRIIVGGFVFICVLVVTIGIAVTIAVSVFGAGPGLCDNRAEGRAVETERQRRQQDAGNTGGEQQRKTMGRSHDGSVLVLI